MCPQNLHRVLKARAAMEGKSLSDYILSELRELAGRPTLREFQERLETRSVVELPESAAVAVRAERDAQSFGRVGPD